jgi:hypothetical protein
MYCVGRVILASYLTVDAGVLDSVKAVYSNTHIHQVFNRELITTQHTKLDILELELLEPVFLAVANCA